MKDRAKILLAAFLAAIAATLAGCSSAFWSGETVYEQSYPANPAHPTMGRREAQKCVRAALIAWGDHKATLTPTGFTAIDFDTRGDRAYRFADVKSLYVWDNGSHRITDYYIRIERDRMAGEQGLFIGDTRTVEQARRVIDAIFALKYYYSDAAFQEAFQAWRLRTAEPGFPEEAQQYRIMAEDAFKNQEYEKALDDYENALAVAPCWPNVQFNAALIAAELRQFDIAARHMRHYLELAPNAANAGAAREKMLLWEGKAAESPNH